MKDLLHHQTSILNIYPKTKRNLTALLDFCFERHKPDDIIWLKSLKLNLSQIQYVAVLIKKHYSYFEKELNPTGLTVENLMSYGIDALSGNEGEWKGSKNRIKITKGFRQLVEEKDEI